jgi:hypothetical protein
MCRLESQSDVIFCAFRRNHAGQRPAGLGKLHDRSGHAYARPNRRSARQDSPSRLGFTFLCTFPKATTNVSPLAKPLVSRDCTGTRYFNPRAAALPDGPRNCAYMCVFLHGCTRDYRDASAAGQVCATMCGSEAYKSASLLCDKLVRVDSNFVFCKLLCISQYSSRTTHNGC